jgi:hypothetical protein
VVGHASTDPVRVAMLPPLGLLALLAASFAVVGFAAARTGADADRVVPLFALLLLAVPYLPWIPDRFPALRALAADARYLLWLAVLWPVVIQTLRRLTPAALFSSPVVVFLVSGAIFGAAAVRLVATPVFPNGDEPHYLVIAQSLLRDGDLKIENNHQRGDYRAYLDGPLRPDYLTRGVDGQIYSIHPVGLPLLAMPAFAFGGYPAVVGMLVLAAALAAALLWGWARDVTGSPSAATFAWASTALTTPYLFNTFTVFPEIPAALAVMVAIAWRPDASSTFVLLLRGAAIAALPWLSTKYAPMAGVLTVALAIRLGWNPRRLFILGAPIALGMTAWFAFFFWIWGTLLPSAPYGSARTTTLTTLARGGPGLLFDQEYGVVAYAPVLALAFVGLSQMFRSGGAAARRALEISLAFGALLATVGAFYLWWGGTASPGRPVASGVLLLGVPIAFLFASCASRIAARAGCHALLAVSLAIACALGLAQQGSLLNNNRDGSALLLAWLSPTWPIWPAFPSFIAGSLTGAVARTCGWLALGAVVAWIVERSKPRTSGTAALATLVVGFACAVVGVSAGTAGTTVPPELAPAARARVPLLESYDAARRPLSIVYDPFSRIDSADALRHVTLVARPGLRTARQPVELLWNARFTLPAGDYRVELTRPAVSPQAPLELGVQIGRVGLPVESWNVTGAVWEHALTLPLDAQFVGFRVSPGVANSDGELTIVPVKILDRSDRFRRPAVLSATRYAAATAYFHDEQIAGEPTGFWTKGGATTLVTYAADASQPTIDVGVHCGPSPNRVTLRVGEWRETFALQPGDTRAIAIPTIAQPALGSRIAPLDVTVESGFVPSDFDAASADRRYLGCWFGMPQPPRH